MARCKLCSAEGVEVAGIAPESEKKGAMACGFRGAPRLLLRAPIDVDDLGAALEHGGTAR
jgi:hypothetical protein